MASMLPTKIEFALHFSLPGFLVQGVVAAVIHHVLITVGLSSDIAFSILCWTLSNVVYVLSTQFTDIFTTLKGLLLFDAIYVIIDLLRVYQ